ncbi:S41 family peptidase [Xanthocytophaga agilis]|uniref:S41 family peptidase n=1 Tax=Xanthocytophaga agilis TaxID=3048010 RepID=A0AAE3RA78_9BACT|nr:S41 family peptidase [Xanthocytophaga agilis]MDJ1506060.1 S41 family peptidase [Xanthocytophaga agilis]
MLIKSTIRAVYLFFVSAVILIWTNCTTTKAPNKIVTRQEVSFLREGSIVNPAIRGYWKSIGNGYILEARHDSILLYSYTTNFCYKEKNDYLEGLLNNEARFSLQKDTLHIYKTDFGDKTTTIQIKHDYVRIDRLPQNHISFSKMQKLSPKQLFNLFIETYEENYAFSKERNVNWQYIKTEFESKISDSTTESELFQFFGQIVTRTKDQHTKIIAENGQTLQYRITPSAEIVAEAFRSQSEIQKLDDYFNLFFTTNYKNISDSLLAGKGHKVANGQLEWGNLTNTIGYLSIYSFTDFASKGTTRKQQIDSLAYHMEQIIGSFKDKEAIIVDVSFNFGGFDAAMLALASYFTDKPTLVYTSQVYTNGKFHDESKVYIQPVSKIAYTKPVYVLMTDISRSAAEGFAMTMKANSNVKLVGTHTLGILSSMLGKSIGNFYATLSNQRLLTPNGKYYEVGGVEPDSMITVFRKENIFGGHKEAVRKLVHRIETR